MNHQESHMGLTLLEAPYRTSRCVVHFISLSSVLSLNGWRFKVTGVMITGSLVCCLMVAGRG